MKVTSIWCIFIVACFFSLRKKKILSYFFCSKKKLILNFSQNRTKSPTTKSNSRKVPCTGGKIMIPCDFCDLGEKTLCLKTSLTSIAVNQQQWKIPQHLQKEWPKSSLNGNTNFDTHEPERNGLLWLIGRLAGEITHNYSRCGPQLRLEPKTLRLPEQGK